MGQEIHRADPRARHLAWLLALVFVAAGGFALYLMHQRLEAAQAMTLSSPRQAAEATVTIARWFFGAVSAGCAVFGLYLVYEGVRVLRSGRYPAPGAWVLSDTPVVRGKAARWRAWVALALSVPILVLGFELPRRGGEKVEDTLWELLSEEEDGQAAP